MIDLHCHLLPHIDDGAPDMATALAMARIAVDDGIRVLACTPHIYPGLYENDAAGIRTAIRSMQTRLDQEGIPLRLVEGADAHVVPELVDGLRSGRVPTLAGSRYFLFEPPHHVAPPRLEDTAIAAMAAGYVPIVTHPERLSWIESHYPVFQRMAQAGAWMQLTAGAVTGRFERRPQYWAERMLDEGLVAVIATDITKFKFRDFNRMTVAEAVILWTIGVTKDKFLDCFIRFQPYSSSSIAVMYNTIYTRL